MKKIFMLACACLLIAACNSNKKSTDNTTIAANTEVTDMHNAENALDYDGTYTGTFPAADCPGINITLTLNKDKTFTQNTSTEKMPPSPIRETIPSKVT